MNFKPMLAIAAVGLAIGAAIGLGIGGYVVVSNRYFAHGLFRLAAMVFQDSVNAYVVYSVIALALYYLICLALVRTYGLRPVNLLRFGAMAVVVVVVGLAADLVLSSHTIFDLMSASKALMLRLGRVLSGRMPAASLIGNTCTGVIVSSGGALLLALLVVLYWRLGKLAWPRVAGLVARRSRMFAVIGIVAAAPVIFTNLYVLVSGWIGPFPGPNVVFVVVDCLRADHLACYGYTRQTSPNIDRLVQSGALFRNAYSAASWTKPSVATMFTSLHPNVHQALYYNSVLPEGAVSIAEVMKDRGYKTFFFSGGNPSIGSKCGFRQGFDVFSDPEPGEDAVTLGERLMSLGRTFRAGRAFVYLHYMDVHLPYNVNRHNRLFGELPRREVGVPGELHLKTLRQLTAASKLTEDDQEALISLYDGQIRFVDESIGRIVGFLASEGVLDNTLIVITSDHGEELWDHAGFEHGHTLYQELIHVPLILAGWGIGCADVETRVGLVDILPTACEAAGIGSGRGGMHGRSLLEGLTDADKRSDSPTFAMSTLYGAEKVCLVRDGWKIIWNRYDRRLGTQLIGREAGSEFELYHLGDDPGEVVNLAADNGEALADLKKHLDAIMSLESTLDHKRAIMDDDLKRRLRAIGYL
jgi:arylsulfatase A-like enzyme